MVAVDGANKRPAVPAVVWLIVVVALALRILGAASGALMYDEAHHWATAQTIADGQSAPVWRSVDHPPMSVYALRLSGALFGDTLFGIRLLHALFGAATVLLVFLLGREIFSEEAGIFAATLLALDQFHLTWSYFAVPEVLFLFFGTWAFIRFRRATASGKIRDFALLGVAMGLTYLAKETAMFLIPVLWLALLVSPTRRRFLFGAGWYVAHAIALAIVLPDLALNYVNWYEGYFFRNTGFLSTSFLPAPRALLLYLGEIVQLYTAPRGGYASNYATQNPAAIHWPAGLLYLGAALWTLRRWGEEGPRLMLLAFWSFVIGFTLMPSDPITRRNWWWASLSVVPAVVCAGELLSTRWRRIRGPRAATGRLTAGKVVVGALLAYLAVHAAQTALRPGVGVAYQSAADYRAEVVSEAQGRLPTGELLLSEQRLFRALHVAGGSADLYALLAHAAELRGRPEQSAYFVEKSLALDPSNPLARDVENRLAMSGRP